MNRSTLKSRVVSGLVCLSLAAVGVFQIGSNNSPIIHDGNAPRATAVADLHLDEIKMTNPILWSAEL